MTITKAQARRFLLMYHGLWKSRVFKGKKGILEYIRRVGCIQFDPLNIVGHNQELVLQSRIPHFKPEMLTDLLYQDRKLIDGWDKNMSIYPVEDWPNLMRVRQVNAGWAANKTELAEVLPKILDEIRSRGPVSSSDLDHKEQVDWFWAPTSMARAALESLYYSGKLVVHHKKKTRRFFDLAERCIPKAIYQKPDPFASTEAYEAWYVKRRIGGIGLLWNKAGDGWLGISNLKTAERTRAINSLLAAGFIDEVLVEGVSTPLYYRSDYKYLLDQALLEDKVPSSAHILAPLDNLIWERKLLLELFDFDYRWEVYKPVTERKFGYYVLPVLYGDRFVARFEPGKDKSGNLVIKNWWWEPDIRVTKRMEAAVKKCLEEFKSFLGAEFIIKSPFST